MACVPGAFVRSLPQKAEGVASQDVDMRVNAQVHATEGDGEAPDNQKEINSELVL